MAAFMRTGNNPRMTHGSPAQPARDNRTGQLLKLDTYSKVKQAMRSEPASRQPRRVYLARGNQGFGFRLSTNSATLDGGYIHYASELDEGGLAQMAGLQLGDRFLDLDGVGINSLPHTHVKALFARVKANSRPVRAVVVPKNKLIEESIKKLMAMEAASPHLAEPVHLNTTSTGVWKTRLGGGSHLVIQMQARGAPGTRVKPYRVDAAELQYGEWADGNGKTVGDLFHDVTNPEAAKELDAAARGKVVLVLRGSVSLFEQIKRCQNAGARACIFVNTRKGAAEELGHEDDDPHEEIHIPGFNVSMKDGVKLAKTLRSKNWDPAKDAVSVTCYPAEEQDLADYPEEEDMVALGTRGHEYQPGMIVTISGEVPYKVACGYAEFGQMLEAAGEEFTLWSSAQNATAAIPFTTADQRTLRHGGNRAALIFTGGNARINRKVEHCKVAGAKAVIIANTVFDAAAFDVPMQPTDSKAQPPTLTLGTNEGGKLRGALERGCTVNVKLFHFLDDNMPITGPENDEYSSDEEELPPGWTTKYDAYGHKYYLNEGTGETMFDNPASVVAQEAAARIAEQEQLERQRQAAAEARAQRQIQEQAEEQARQAEEQARQAEEQARQTEEEARQAEEQARLEHARIEQEAAAAAARAEAEDEIRRAKDDQAVQEEEDRAAEVAAAAAIIQRQESVLAASHAKDPAGDALELKRQMREHFLAEYKKYHNDQGVLIKHWKYSKWHIIRANLWRVNKIGFNDPIDSEFKRNPQVMAQRWKMDLIQRITEVLAHTKHSAKTDVRPKADKMKSLKIRVDKMHRRLSLSELDLEGLATPKSKGDAKLLAARAASKRAEQEEREAAAAAARKIAQDKAAMKKKRRSDVIIAQKVEQEAKQAEQLQLEAAYQQRRKDSDRKQAEKRAALEAEKRAALEAEEAEEQQMLAEEQARVEAEEAAIRAAQEEEAAKEKEFRDRREATERRVAERKAAEAAAEQQEREAAEAAEAAEVAEREAAEAAALASAEQEAREAAAAAAAAAEAAERQAAEAEEREAAAAEQQQREAAEAAALAAAEQEEREAAAAAEQQQREAAEAAALATAEQEEREAAAASTEAAAASAAAAAEEDRRLLAKIQEQKAIADREATAEAEAAAVAAAAAAPVQQKSYAGMGRLALIKECKAKGIEYRAVAQDPAALIGLLEASQSTAQAEIPVGCDPDPEWLHGVITRQVASQLLQLRGAHDGCFLIRRLVAKAATDATMCLSVVHNMKPTHHKITRDAKGKLMIGKFKPMPRPHGCSTIADLIEFLGSSDVNQTTAPKWPVLLTAGVTISGMRLPEKWTKTANAEAAALATAATDSEDGPRSNLRVPGKASRKTSLTWADGKHDSEPGDYAMELAEAEQTGSRQKLPIRVRWPDKLCEVEVIPRHAAYGRYLEDGSEKMPAGGLYALRDDSINDSTLSMYYESLLEAVPYQTLGRFGPGVEGWSEGDLVFEANEIINVWDEGAPDTGFPSEDKTIWLIGWTQDGKEGNVPATYARRIQMKGGASVEKYGS